MRLKKEYDNWQQLCKNKTCSSDPERKREIFAEALSKLWDIGASNAIQTIQKNKMSKERKAEDIFFYEDQQSARKGVIGGKDALYKKSVQKRQERFARSIVVTQSSSDDETDVESFSQSSSAASNPCSSSEKEQVEPADPSSPSFFVTLNVPKNLINCTEITQVLDRFKTSDNAATMLVASFIKACQGDVNDFCLSRSTTYRARIANRLRISDEIFKEIRKALSQDLALHWDGKLTKDCFGNKYEALSVLISRTSTYRGQAFGSTEVRKSKWNSSCRCKL